MIAVQGIIVDLEFALKQLHESRDFLVLTGQYSLDLRLKLDIAIKRLETLILILEDVKDRVIE